MATSNLDNTSSFSKGSDAEYNLICKPCYIDDVSKPAYGYCKDCMEHLCAFCFKSHKKSKPSRHHKLLDSDSMPSTQSLDDTDTTVDEGPADSLSTPCERHSEEYIKLYCHDHKMTLCSICVALNHTKPCKVEYIPDISRNFLNSDTLRKVISRAQSVEDWCDAINNRMSRDTQQTTDSLKRSLSDLKKYRSNINKRLDKLETDINRRIHDLQEQNKKKIKTTETKCDVLKNDAIIKKDTLSELNESNQANQLFIQIQEAQRILEEYEDILHSIESQNFLDEYQFIPNQALNDVIQSDNALGNISSHNEVRLPSTTEDDTPQRPHQRTVIKPTEQDEILVKTKEDESHCYITGMTNNQPGTLVLADYNNKCIKVVDVNNKVVTSTLSFGDDKPLDITSVSNTEVAVTIPDSQYIQFVTTSNRLKKSRKINTNGYCYGICYHQDKLIVTYDDPGKLEILDMKGKVIKSITKDTTDQDIFSKPYYVQVYNNFIFVSDYCESSIIKLDLNCEIKSIYEGVNEPSGFAVLPDRRSFVVCSDGDNKVYEVDYDKKSKVLIKDVARPQAVCVNDKQNRLYISRWPWNNKSVNNNHNIIIVFNI
ncbi:hypothetical protein ACF0H5_024023 [Mactra antiquata]